MCKLTITLPFHLLTNVGQASDLIILVKPARVGCYMLKYGTHKDNSYGFPWEINVAVLGGNSSFICCKNATGYLIQIL